jgi:hypothetical protein
MELVKSVRLLVNQSASQLLRKYSVGDGCMNENGKLV